MGRIPVSLNDRRAGTCITAAAVGLSAGAVIAMSVLMPPRGVAHAQGMPPPPAVTVETVQSIDVKHAASFSGRIEAIDKVELRPRVAGFIVKRGFHEGDDVEKGQVLFEIDPRAYRIALTQAEANLASSEAALADAADAHERTQELASRQVSSVATLSAAKARLAQARAKVDFDRSQVEQAKLNLDFTEIRAPISGRIGRAVHAVGDFVNEASPHLATLISHEEMYVTFSVPRAALAGIKRTAEGRFDADVEIRHSDREIYPVNGKIAFVDVEANAATNTLTVRAVIPNPDRRLVAQELVDVVIVDRDATKRLVVSQSALMIDQLGTYVLVVDESNKVEQRRFEVGEHRGATVTVKSGLNAGDRVIVGGHLKAQPGMVVAPEAQAIEVSNAEGNPTP